MKKTHNKKLLAVRNLPPSYHRLPGKEYDVKKSEVIAWLIQRPSVLEYVWDQIKQSGDVIYDSDTGKWQGVDYDAD